MIPKNKIIKKLEVARSNINTYANKSEMND